MRAYSHTGYIFLIFKTNGLLWLFVLWNSSIEGLCIPFKFSTRVYNLNVWEFWEKEFKVICVLSQIVDNNVEFNSINLVYIVTFANTIRLDEKFAKMYRF